MLTDQFLPTPATPDIPTMITQNKHTFCQAAESPNRGRLLGGNLQILCNPLQPIPHMPTIKAQFLNNADEQIHRIYNVPQNPHQNNTSNYNYFGPNTY